MKIEDYLTDNSGEALLKYFVGDVQDRVKIYQDKKTSISHDEPWLTLVAVYSLFGDQKGLYQHQIDAFNELIKISGLPDFKPVDTIIQVKLEKKLPEIQEYRTFLKDNTIHFYPDRIKKIEEKRQKKNASFEGSTNLDLFIEAERNGEPVIFFIEAKFLSDLSYQITYNPFRDQIARNIDCGIDYCKFEENNVPIENFHFLILTPKLFRIEEYGEEIQSSFDTQNSRLYCYKMRNYLNPMNLVSALPHRDISELAIIKTNMGWVTFEDIFRMAVKYQTQEDSILEGVKDFLKERNLS